MSAEARRPEVPPIKKVPVDPRVEALATEHLRGGGGALDARPAPRLDLATRSAHSTTSVASDSP